MHSMTLEDGWLAHFNGDFSGMIEFVRRDGVAVFLPFSIIEAVVAEKLRRDRIAQLEEASPKELLRA